MLTGGGEGDGITGDKAVTSVWFCFLAFVSVKPLDTFEEDLGTISSNVCGNKKTTIFDRELDHLQLGLWQNRYFKPKQGLLHT